MADNARSDVDTVEGQHSATGEAAVEHLGHRDHGDGHAVVANHGDSHGDAHGAHQHRDPMAEPSAEWGWHGTFPRAARVGGWAFVAIFLLMLIGNHEGRVEDLWLVGLALGAVVVLVWDQVRRRTAWRK